MTTPTIAGIDVSQHQPLGRINWKHLHDQENVRFVVARSGYGIGPDATCSTHLREARAGGVELIGCYHVLRASRPIRPQVDLLVQACGEFGCETLPVLDFEIMDGMSAQAVADAAIGFIETAEALLYRRVILYTYPYFASPLPLSADLARRPLWIAHYPKAGKTLLKPTVPKPWSDWTIWQHSGDGGPKHNGIVLDRNVYRGTVEQMKCELLYPLTLKPEPK